MSQFVLPLLVNLEVAAEAVEAAVAGLQEVVVEAMEEVAAVAMEVVDGHQAAAVEDPKVRKNRSASKKQGKIESEIVNQN